MDTAETAGTGRDSGAGNRQDQLTTAELAIRVDDIFGILLTGARTTYVYEWVRTQREEWGVSTRTVDRYIRKAKKLLLAKAESDRDEELGRHKARLEDLYSRSYLTGDYRGALLVTQERAKLADLYPPKRTELSGPDGGPVRVFDLSKLSTEELEALLPIVEKLESEDGDPS